MKTLEDKDWDSLIRTIQDGNCTPFLGAGACAGFIPLGSQVAQEWAKMYGYPLSDPWDLTRVAQFLAIKRYPMFPKDEMVRLLKHIEKRPDFNDPTEPHGVLSNLPLPIYMTTNYDDFMVRALRSRNRNPSRELCRWNSLVRDQPSVFDPGSGSEVSGEHPVVFHLHGHDEVPESLVLTEDDYLDFMGSISKEQIIPRRIERALVSTSLLFIGYRLADWDFRVLFRGLIGSLERSLGRIRIAVQLAPEPPEMGGITQEQVQRYLEDYLAKDDVRVYWGMASDFIQELWERWEAFNGDN